MSCLFVKDSAINSAGRQIRKHQSSEEFQAVYHASDLKYFTMKFKQILTIVSFRRVLRVGLRRTLVETSV